MQKHPFFSRLLMHSDDELAERLGAGIVERETLHQWPLSCVQRLLLENGKKLIYKSQLPPTVEAEFYECASSALLADYQVLDKLEDCSTMTIDWIDAPLLRNTASEKADLIDHGKQVMEQICEIRGELPVYLDVGTKDAWQSVTELTLEKFQKLVMDKRFPSTHLEQLELVRQWTNSAEPREVISRESRVIHGDFKADQVFVTADGYRVIDWQRPILAPPEVDLVCFLVEEGIDPRQHVRSAIVKLFWFLRLHWAVEAQFDLLPDFRGRLFDQWSSEAVRQICS